MSDIDVPDQHARREVLIPRMSRRVFFNSCEEFDFRLLFALSYVGGGGAEQAECYAAVQGVGDYDFAGWHAGWLGVAEKVLVAADDDRRNGRSASARAGYQRASTYFYQSAFFLPAGSEEFLSLHRRSTAAFESAAELPGAEFRRVLVPFEGASLPGWFFPAGTNEPARTLIVFTGTDATNEQLYYFAGGRRAAERGWNLLCVSGPGQFSTLEVEPGLTFRPDYDVVLRAVVDHLETVPEVDSSQLAVMGFSKGGYLAPRGVAGDDRIKALVANSPITNFHDVIWPGVQRMLNHSDAMQEWVTSLLQWIYGASSIDEVEEITRDYNLDGLVEAIRCPTLILDSVGEGPTFREQTLEFQARLKAPQTVRHFTAEEAADAHCQIGNWALMHQVVYDWLDTVLPTSAGEA